MLLIIINKLYWYWCGCKCTGSILCKFDWMQLLYYLEVLIKWIWGNVMRLFIYSIENNYLDATIKWRGFDEDPFKRLVILFMIDNKIMLWFQCTVQCSATHRSASQHYYIDIYLLCINIIMIVGNIVTMMMAAAVVQWPWSSQQRHRNDDDGNGSLAISGQQIKYHFGSFRPNQLEIAEINLLPQNTNAAVGK